MKFIPNKRQGKGQKGYGDVHCLLFSNKGIESWTQLFVFNVVKIEWNEEMSRVEKTIWFGGSR